LKEKDQSVRIGVLFKVAAWRTARKFVVLRGWIARETLVIGVPSIGVTDDMMDGEAEAEGETREEGPSEEDETEDEEEERELVVML